MKKALQIALIATLLALFVLQILIAKGVFQRQQTAQVCPVDAITMVGGKAVIDEDKCIGCRRCVDGVIIPQTKPSREIEPTEVPQAIAHSETKLEIPGSAPTAPIPKETEAEKPAPQPVTSYTVIEDACIGCTLCVRYCPVNAITMVEGKAVIDPKKCISCGICVDGDGASFAGCPVAAIEKP